MIRPDGTVLVFPHTATTGLFDFGPGEADDMYFGVSQLGTWQAQVIVNGIPSNSVAWEVLWSPVHVTR